MNAHNHTTQELTNIVLESGDQYAVQLVNNLLSDIEDAKIVEDEFSEFKEKIVQFFASKVEDYYQDQAIEDHKNESHGIAGDYFDSLYFDLKYNANEILKVINDSSDLLETMTSAEYREIVIDAQYGAEWIIEDIEHCGGYYSMPDNVLASVIVYEDSVELDDDNRMITDVIELPWDIDVCDVREQLGDTIWFGIDLIYLLKFDVKKLEFALLEYRKECEQ